jgi:CheY-like chemotaxis protein
MINPAMNTLVRRDQRRDRGDAADVRLALTSAPSPPTPAPDAEEFNKSEGLRVLVVDDNIDSAMMLATWLRLVGYCVQSACTGPDGLKVALQWRPDVVLLDIGLPGLDGYEVARRLRDNPALMNAGVKMRLIALTGYGRDTDITVAQAAGFDAPKPVEMHELERLLVTAVRAGV